MDAYQRSQQWLVVGIVSLLLAGFLSFVLVVGRAPGLHHLITDPEFARRSLVVHVNLSLFVWLSSILASLYALLPGKRNKIVSRIEPPYLASIGIVLLLASGASNATPVMSNYIPVLDHPVFFIGMGCILLALLLTYFDPFPLHRRVFVDPGHPVLPVEVQWGLRWAALAFLITVATLGITYLRFPQPENIALRYDWLFWGAGHVLQVVNVVGMLNVWLIVLAKVHPPSVPSLRWVNTGFAVLVLPILYAPYLAFHAANPGVYYVQFTRLMQFGIFPGVLMMLFGIGYRYWRYGNTVSVTNQGMLWGFLTSVVLILTGFILGALIRVSNTLVPAHYHAAIGSVTVIYMVMAYLLLERFGFPIPAGSLKRMSAWQPVIFGFGQTIFAVGFGLAGLARKVYGAEQHISTLREFVGMGLVGLGGLMAITGGVLFVWIVLSALSPAIPVIIKKRRALWKAIKSIPFRS